MPSGGTILRYLIAFIILLFAGVVAYAASVAALLDKNVTHDVVLRLQATGNALSIRQDIVLMAMLYAGMVSSFVLITPVTRPASPVALALFHLTLLLGVGAVLGKISFASAAVILALGSAACTTTWLLAAMLLRGEAIEIESRWIGLGGGLGGWRLSRAASLALLSFASTAAVIAALSMPAPEKVAAKPPETGQQVNGGPGAAGASKPGEVGKPTAGDAGAAGTSKPAEAGQHAAGAPGAEAPKPPDQSQPAH